MKNALIKMHVAVLLWGFTGVLGRAITLNAAVLVWYRMALTALLIGIIITYRKQWQKVPLPDVKQMAIVGGLMALHWVAFYGAIKEANASIALLCLSTSPVFTTFFHWVINKALIKPTELLLGVLALVGMGLIYGFQPGHGVGILLGIIAAILAALFTVLNKKIAHKHPARLMVFFEMGTGLLCLMALMPFMWASIEGPIRLVPSLTDALWLLVLSLCCTVWAQSLAISALKHISSFTATLTVNLEPVYGIILAFLIYREQNDLQWSAVDDWITGNTGFHFPLPVGFVAGTLLIALSVLLQMRPARQGSQDAKTAIADRGGID
jgi:drug/metabolite transporter (DMT)-like permease